MKKILLVEDMKGVRESLEIILSSRYDLDITDNATEGLRRIRAGSYDLVITDIVMPGMDGNELIVQAKRACDTPVLAISAGGSGVSSDHTLMLARQQADGVLEKPFSKNALLAKVQQMTGEAA